MCMNEISDTSVGHLFKDRSITLSMCTNMHIDLTHLIRNIEIEKVRLSSGFKADLVLLNRDAARMQESNVNSKR